MRPLDDYTEKVLSSRARGAVYPYELAPMLAGPDGSFVEHDLDDDGPAGAGRAAARAEQGGHRRRRRQHADRAVSRRA